MSARQKMRDEAPAAEADAWLPKSLPFTMIDQVSCNNEYAERPSFCVITVDERLIRRILQLHETVVSVGAAQITDYSCPSWRSRGYPIVRGYPHVGSEPWFSEDELEQEWNDSFPPGDGNQDEDSEWNTDGDKVVVYASGSVWWKAYDRRADGVVFESHGSLDIGHFKWLKEKFGL
jgi:hypothetical protein